MRPRAGVDWRGDPSEGVARASHGRRLVFAHPIAGRFTAQTNPAAVATPHRRSPPTCAGAQRARLLPEGDLDGGLQRGRARAGRAGGPGLALAQPPG
eukprot:scaffold25025_cov129-Isochrysis_galbana.AAC.3